MQWVPWQGYMTPKTGRKIPSTLGFLLFYFKLKCDLICNKLRICSISFNKFRQMYIPLKSLPHIKIININTTPSGFLGLCGHLSISSSLSSKSPTSDLLSLTRDLFEFSSYTHRKHVIFLWGFITDHNYFESHPWGCWVSVVYSIIVK